MTNDRITVLIVSLTDYVPCPSPCQKKQNTKIKLNLGGVIKFTSHTFLRTTVLHALQEAQQSNNNSETMVNTCVKIYKGVFLDTNKQH